MFFLSFSFFSSGFFFFQVFPRKILILLILEFLFLLVLFFTFLFKSVSSFNFFLFLILLIFLVLDSVLGVSVLVSVSRKSGPYSCWFF